MNFAQIDPNWESYLTQAMPTSWTWEIAIHLANEHPWDVWFIVIEPGIAWQEEIVFYHRKNGNIVYTYHGNRTNPITHPTNSQVMTSAISYINYLIGKSFEQHCMVCVDDKNITIQWWPYYVNGQQVVVKSLYTTPDHTGNPVDPDHVLTPNSVNYIYLCEDPNNLWTWKYVITSTQDLTKYQVWQVSTHPDGTILSKDTTKTLPIGNGLSTTMQNLINSFDPNAEENVQSDWAQTNTSSDDYIKNKPTIPAAQIKVDWNQTDPTKIDCIVNKPTLSIYQLISNLVDSTTTLNTKATASDTKYLSEKAIICALDEKVNTSTWMGLSQNNFTNTYKDILDSLWDYEDQCTYIWWHWVSITDLWNDVKKISTYDTPLVPVQMCQNATIWPTERMWWELQSQWYWRCIILSDWGKSWLWGEVWSVEDFTWMDMVKVFVKNTEWLSTIQIETVIEVLNSTWETDTHYQQAYTTPLNITPDWEWYFELWAASFWALDFTDAKRVRISVYRVPLKAESCTKWWIATTWMCICFTQDEDEIEMESGSVFNNECPDLVIDVPVSYPDFLLQVYDEDGFQILPEDLQGTTLSFDDTFLWKIITIPWMRYTHSWSSTVWTITHSMWTEDILSNVYVWWSLVLPEDIIIIDPNTIEIHFDVAVSWEVILAPWVRFTWSWTSWNIAHWFWFEDIYIEYYNDDWERIHPEDVLVVDSNNVLATFDTSISWFAIVRYIKYNIDEDNKDICCCPKKWKFCIWDWVNTSFQITHNFWRELYSMLAKQDNKIVEVEFTEVNYNTLQVDMNVPKKVCIFLIA